MSDDSWGGDLGPHRDEVARHTAEWRRALFGTDRDDRIVSVMDPCGSPAPQPSLEELVSLFETRASRGCVPLSGLTFPSSPDPYTLERFLQIANLVGTGLRQVIVPLDMLRDLGGFQVAISVLDRASPNLESFHIRGKSVEGDGLSPTSLPTGMQNLYRFTIDKHTGPLSTMELAVAVRNLGSAKNFVLLHV